MNTYVLAKAFGEVMVPGDEVIVTNQDHEANTGAVRRMADAVGATTIEWAVDPDSGLLDPEVLGALLTSRTKLVTFPHASNIVGQENDVQLLTAMAHEAGARVIVDGVSFAPHSLVSLPELNPDVYLFSLYKVYSVHQGLMVVRNGLIDELPNQGHYFNADLPGKRLTPAGPDHAQIAAAGAVLDYIEAVAARHDGPAGLGPAVAFVSELWRNHESQLLEPLLEFLREQRSVRILGPDLASTPGDLHRCPTVAFAVEGQDPAQVVERLANHRIMAGAGHFYARRLVEALGIDAATGVVRLSFVHYTDMAEISALIEALQEALS
jgi:selenocysteine lyase/cysteine desulfurase